VLEMVAGLLSAGLLVTGVLLAVLEIAAPALFPGSGLTVTEGPRWDRVLVPVGVGIAGEVARCWRHRIGGGLRPGLAATCILLCLVALWWGWWR
jgi:hypothetical protein